MSVAFVVASEVGLISVNVEAGYALEKASVTRSASSSGGLRPSVYLKNMETVYHTCSERSQILHSRNVGTLNMCEKCP